MKTALSSAAPRASAEPPIAHATSPWRRLLARLLAWAFPPHESVDDYEPYPAVDRSGLAAELDLDATAARLGALDQPGPDTSREASAEPTIDAHVQALVQEAGRRVAVRLRSLDSSIRAINLDRGTGRVEQLGARFEAEAAKVLGDGRRELETLVDTHRRTLAEHDAFRARHGLARGARLPDSTFLAWVWLAGIVIVETGINALFFAEGSDRGLVGGGAQALVISVVNVGLAWFVARWPLRWAHHRRAAWSVLGTLAVGLYVVVLFGAAWFVTLYREAFTVAPDAALEAALAAARDGRPWPVRLDSWGFWLASVGFALLALFKVHRMDDPYPGFGASERRLRRSEQDVQEERDRWVRELEHRRAECVAELDALADELDDAADRLVTIGNVHDKLRNGWTPYVESLRSTHRALVGQFRQENLAARTAPAPAWFDEAPALDVAAFGADAQELPDIRAAGVAVRALQHDAAARSIRLTERYNDVVAALDDGFDARQVGSRESSA